MDRDFTADDRAALEGAAGELFVRAVAAPMQRPGDPLQGAAFDLLVDLGLLQSHGEDAYVAADPVTVQSNMVAPLGLRAAALLREASEWSQTLEGMSKRFREMESSVKPVTMLRGVRNISQVIEVSLDDAAEELLTAQPTVNRKAGIDQAAQRDVRTVQRGVSMRTLYQHSARKSTAIQAYVDTIQAHGAQVRTLDEFFQRLIVIDRKLAFVPGSDGLQVALAVREPNLVSYLVDIFEHFWGRAQPFVDRQESTASTIANDVRNMTIRMLTEGHADPSSAKRMGVSTRTYAGYIAALKDEFGAQTRFQLGYAIGLEDARDEDDDDF